MNKQITVFSGILFHDGKILMSQRDEVECPEAHMKWELPGGKCDFGETPQQAVKREFSEETGREIEVVKLLPYTGVNYWDYEWGKQQTLCFVFLCKLIKEGEPAKKDHHVADIKWIPIDEVKNFPTLPDMDLIVDLAKKELGLI